MSKSAPIIYTWTDEAPALATHSLLPIIRKFAGVAHVPVETRDISLSARLLAAMASEIEPSQRVSDDLAELGKLVKTPDANIIKLPNISASVPQLQECIAELQAKGYAVPDYPEEPQNDEEREIQARYNRIKGSAVNPVLRQGNSDRRVPKAVKEFARKHPVKMRPWESDSKTHVATMSAGDFKHNEKAVTIAHATDARIEHVAKDGTVTVMKKSLPLLEGEILDGTYMSKRALVAFLQEQMADAKAKGVLFSIHLKATMMKVSDPIMFGHCVRVFFKDVFAKYAATFDRLGVDPNHGFAAVLDKIATLPEAERAPIEADIQAAYSEGPSLAMVDSDKGINNLYVPSDIIIDASMPPMIRDGGRMWNADGKLQDCKAVIPDSSYAGVYQATIEDCQAHGAFDPTTMGSVSNVGLMAEQAEEYGSHDKTFEVPSAGTMRVVDAQGNTLIENEVEAGDIWRGCQAKDAPIRDWVELAVRRARASGDPAIFWLDSDRAHDNQVINKVETYLPELDTTGLEIKIMSTVEATKYSLERIRRGEDTISVTGNVLRDFLTDLFPILEVGTSARTLSIVPLMSGGGLFETGAGGSAPKHVQQFEKEGHLRWDSLGEYLALAASLEFLAEKYDNEGARILGNALDAATTEYLQDARSPSRRVHEIDNRGSTFYLTLAWAQALAAQGDNAEVAARFKPVAEALGAKTETILKELLDAQGSPQDIGGYYRPDPERTDAAMRPSATFNAVIEGI